MSHSAPNAIKRCVAATSKHLSLNGDANKGEQAQPMVPENNLCRQYKEKVQPCIDLIDSLRALGVEQDLALPAIAVIGDQSSGKSSVLEALSGVALPRGSGIVTRCPLVLKLKKLDQEEGWRGKLSYLQVQEDIADTSKVEGAVIKAQNFITGTRLGIKDELISLEISSPSVPDLTLIDLPGITRVAVGNQPEDIGCQIKRLIMKYIEKAETINLVVVPSNVDIATTEALSMAKQVDPEGDRTIGILTKPDLVDKGTEDKVVDVVHNLLCPLKKGYMVVRCRSQQDIQARLSPTEALQREQAFFEDHPLFRVLLEEGKATVPRLAERLSSELITHICKSLPLLENTIKERHQEITEELQKYGMDIPEDGNEKTIFLIQKISAFNKDIRALVEGEESVGKNGTRLFARLRQKFQGWNSMIEEHFEKGYDGLKSKVWQFESQHCGKELPGFVNYRTFETLMKSQLQALEEPAVELLHEVTVCGPLDGNPVDLPSGPLLASSTDLHLRAPGGRVRAAPHTYAQLWFETPSLRFLKGTSVGFLTCTRPASQLSLPAKQNRGHPVGRRRSGREGDPTSLPGGADRLLPGPGLPRRAAAGQGGGRPEILPGPQFCSPGLCSPGLRCGRSPAALECLPPGGRTKPGQTSPPHHPVLRPADVQPRAAERQLLQDKEACAWLLQEGSSSTKRRKDLKGRLERLGQAQHQLTKFPG